MIQKKLTNNNGFLLLDSLFSIVVISVALGAIISMIAMGLHAYSKNNEQTRAYQIAASYGDALQSLSIDNWYSLVNSADYKAIDISQSNLLVYNYLSGARNTLASLDGAQVNIAGKISPSASAAHAGDRLAQVRIEVTWNNGANNVQLIKYYVRDHQPN